jgi:hypothetical protein
MLMENKCSRREFIAKYFFAGPALLAGAWVLGSCQPARAVAQRAPQQEPGPVSQTTPTPANQTTPAPGAHQAPKPGAQAPGNAATNPCDDLTGVSPGEVDKRKKLAYVTKSPLPDSQCGNCSLYVPPAGGKACGGCMLFKGPVRAEGYCTYWAPIS